LNLFKNISFLIFYQFFKKSLSKERQILFFSNPVHTPKRPNKIKEDKNNYSWNCY